MKKLLLLIPALILILCGASAPPPQTFYTPDELPDEFKEVYPEYEQNWYKTNDEIIQEAALDTYKKYYNEQQLSTFKKQYTFAVEGGIYDGYRISVNSTIYSDPSEDVSDLQSSLYNSLWEIYQRDQDFDESLSMSRSEFEQNVTFKLLDEWDWKKDS